MENSMYQKIFELYCLKTFTKGKNIKAVKNDNDKIRKLIKRHFKKEFCKDQETTWDSLSLIDQNRFIYIIIKEPIFLHYQTDNGRQKKITKVIDAFLNKEFLQAKVDLQNYNDDIEKAFAAHYKSDTSDDEQRIAYLRFCKDLSALYPQTPIPPYEKWLADNQNYPALKIEDEATGKKIYLKGNGMRPYDYYMSYENECKEACQTEYYGNYVPASHFDVDHILIKIILKILQEKNNVQINIPLIYECLSFIQNFQKVDDCLLLDKYDSTLKRSMPNEEKEISKEEQLKTIEDNEKYMTYKRMLAELKFY